MRNPWHCERESSGAANAERNFRLAYPGLAVSVEGGVANGACLPAAMHPQPLRWILANRVFEHRGEAGGIVGRVGFGVARVGKGEFGVEVEHVLALRLLPQQEAGQNGRARLE